MGFIDNTRIKSKILTMIISVSLIGIAGVGYVSNNYRNTDATYTAFVNQDSAATLLLGRANTNVVAAGYSAYRTLAYPAASPLMAGLKKEYAANIAQAVERMQKAKSLLPRATAEIDEFLDDVKKIELLTTEAVNLGAQDRNDEAKTLLFRADVKMVEVRGEIRAWIDKATDDLQQRSDELSADTDRTIVTSLLGLSILFIIGIALSLLMSTRGITRPIHRLRERMLTLAEGETSQVVYGLGRKDEIGEMAAAVSVFRDNAIGRQQLEAEAESNRSQSERERLERDAEKARDDANIQFAVQQLASGLEHLAEGDVGHRLTAAFTTDLDRLRENFNHSMDKLQQTLQAVGQSARRIDAGANELRSSADDLARRTEQQSASVEETAAALEQITTTVKDSARRAEEMGALVAKARAGAEKSGAVVSEAVAAMQKIEQSSTEISNIIGVIDEIAFQTNLLALNAGVEAARAGDAGKGFAVVAQEVRELAQRSAKAAKEIKALISTSGEQVRAGVRLVSETGTALNVIVGEVQDINKNVAAIVEASREQSIGLQEINTAVNTMDQGTQQNAAMVEQATAASHGLSQDAASLTRQLTQFNLGAASAPIPLATSKLAQSTDTKRPVSSPARALGRKLATAFSGSAATAAQATNWEEF